MNYKILSVESDSKTIKGTEYGYLTGIFYGAPHTIASKKSLCSHATERCIADCLFNSGLARVYPKVKEARIRKTRLLLDNPESFYALLDRDIITLKREASRRGLSPAVRLNGTTDKLFERDPRALSLMHKHSDVQFYDYTKVPLRFRTARPSNYHLTFSLSETNLKDAIEALNLGANVAVVFKTKLFPSNYLGAQVIDGDLSDLRFLDSKALAVSTSRGLIVGLSLKGIAQKRKAKNGQPVFAN